jgi:uncharacterized membrane protein YvbJ
MSEVYGGVKCGFCGSENHVMAKRCLTCGMPLDGSRKQAKTRVLEPIDLTKYRAKKKNAAKQKARNQAQPYSLGKALIIVIVIAFILTQLGHIIDLLKSL